MEIFIILCLWFMGCRHSLVILQEMQILPVILLIISLSPNGFGILDTGLIKAFFQLKHTTDAVILGCFTRWENVRLWKEFLKGNQMLLITTFAKVDATSALHITHRQEAVIIDGDCNQTLAFLIESGKLRMYDVKHQWLIIFSRGNFSSLLNQVEMYINADIHVAYPKDLSEENKNYTVEDVYNPAFGKGGELRRKIIGFYTAEDGYKVNVPKCKYCERKDMTNLVLQTEVVLPGSFQGHLLEHLRSQKHREVNTLNRFAYNVFEYCVEYYNFTTSISMTKSFGYKTEDETFDGLAGDLEKRVVDYGSSPLIVRSDRAEILDFGRRIWILRPAFFFRNPASVRSMDIFLKPLSLSIWFLTFACAFFVTVFLKLSFTFERWCIRRRIEYSWSFFILYTIGAFCQQGLTPAPTLLSGRITALFLLLLSLLIYQFYSASLVSHLLMKPTTSIKSLRDILTSNMNAGCEDILYDRDYLMHTTDKLSQEIYFNKILGRGNSSNFLSPEEGLNLVKQGGYAFHVERATAYSIIAKTFPEEVICELDDIPMYKTRQMHASYQKHSPFKEMFDNCLHRLSEYGIMDREIKFWHPRKPVCVRSKSVFFNIGLEYFYSALMVLIIGFSLSLIILGVERRIHNMNQKENDQRNPTVVYSFTL